MENEENKPLGKDSENENKTIEKTEKTLLKDNKGENNDSITLIEKKLENVKEASEKLIKEEFEEDLENVEENGNISDLDLVDGDSDDDDLGFDPDDLDDIPEGEDLFQDVVDGDGDEGEPLTKTVKEVKEKVASSRNTELLERATLLALSKVDIVKAKLCSKISQEHFSEYLGDKETIEIFIEAFKVYMEEKEVSEPSPFATLMLALGMWTLPPLGMAILERFNVLDFFDKKEAVQPQARTSNNLNQETEIQGESVSDSPKIHSHLKEFQEKRKKFSLNASGKYNFSPNGKTYLNVDIADEYPSPVIQSWLDNGEKNKEIIKLLDYGE